MCSYSFYIIRLSFFLFIAVVSVHFASDVLFKLKHIIYVYEKMQIEPSNYQIENWSHTYLMIYYTFANSISILGDLVVINDLNWSLSNLLADAIGIQNWKCASNLSAFHLRYGWYAIPFPYNYLGIYNLYMWERHYSLTAAFIIDIQKDNTGLNNMHGDHVIIIIQISQW